ncbi:hypothetical protein [Brevundimonas sp.]|uniref:hypothetical protein n=1 Tax=Brevundimonas sp. TaxID=1871086 RepID=UPI002EDAB930
MVIFALTALLTTAPLQDPPPAPAPQQAPAAEEPTRLEDVTVTGRPLDQLIEDFVGEVAEPNRHRGLARWEERVCVGVANLTGETAQYLADRISTVAEDVGLEVGGPGCTPNIMVVATDDGGALARTLVEERGRAFRMGGAGMDRGGDALADFVETDRPVRWWQMSLPVDAETGDRAVRIPGDCRNSCTGAADAAPQIGVFAASRLNTQIVDALIRTIVIVDVGDVAGLSVLQLADYIAMVSLAQIDPDADTSRYASILNVFDDPEGSASVTDWDRAYLAGLYGAERNDANWRANRAEIAGEIRRAHRRARDGEAGAEPAAEE